MTTSPPNAMTSQALPGSLSADDFNLSTKDADDYAIARLRSAAFDAVLELWRVRQSEGMSQKDLAACLDRDQGWVSRALRGPANWEFKTFARLVRALRGEAEIKVYKLEEPLSELGNHYDAYRDNDALRQIKPITSTKNFTSFGTVGVS